MKKSFVSTHNFALKPAHNPYDPDVADVDRTLISPASEEDSIQKNEVRPRGYSAWIIFAVIAIIYAVFRMSSSDQVILNAKSWNNGYVHVWQSIIETPGAPGDFTDVRDGTYCTKLDNKQHPLVGDGPPIYYYRVNCSGIVGYVEIDQVR